MTPTGIDAQIVKIEYSTSSGRTWINAPILSGASTTDATFGVPFTDLSEGTNGVLWRAKDTRKLYGKASHPILVDGTPPKVPTVTFPEEGAVIGDGDDENPVKKGVQIHVTGRAEPLATVMLASEGMKRTIKASFDGSFMFRDVDVGAKGKSEFSISAEDTAGNRGKSMAVNFVLDNAPEVTILSPKQGRALSRTATVRWEIRDADNDPIQNVSLSYRKGRGTFIRLPIDQSKNSFVWNVASLGQAGDYELKLEAGDGFAIASETIPFSIDRVAPTLSSFSLTDSILGKSDTLKARGQASDKESGIEYVEYAVQSSLFPGEKQWATALITEGFLRRSASFSIAYPKKLEDGSYDVVARAVDAAGNTSEEVSRSITVDGTPPHIGSFRIVRSGTQLMPDRDGVMEVYKNSTDVFGVSLEGDTASASLKVGDKMVPLIMNAATGLWEATLTADVSAEKSPIKLSAEDRLRNKVSDQEIGMLSPVERGFVLDKDSRFVAGARLRVKVLNPTTGAHSPFTVSGGGGIVDKNGAYELVLPQGEYIVTASAEGHNADAHTLVLDRTSIINISFTIEKRTGVWGAIQNFLDRFNQDL